VELKRDPLSIGDTSFNEREKTTTGGLTITRRSRGDLSVPIVNSREEFPEGVNHSPALRKKKKKSKMKEFREGEVTPGKKSGFC